MKTFYTNNQRLKRDLNILILSDIHYVPKANLNYLYHQIELLDKQRCDYVFILGDIINDSKYGIEDLKELRDCLISLTNVCKKHNTKIFAILGNHDQMTKRDNWCEFYNQEYVAMLRNIEGFNLLENELFQDNDVAIAGTKFYASYYLNQEPLKQYLHQMQKFRWNDYDSYNILLDHSPRRVFNPSIFNALSTLEATDLVLSGHYHNGCVPNFLNFIPNNRGIISPYMYMFPNNARGKKQINDRTSGYISPAVIEFSDDKPFLSKFNFLYRPTTQKILVKKIK